MFHVKIISKWLDQSLISENLIDYVVIILYGYLLSYFYLCNCNFWYIFVQ